MPGSSSSPRLMVSAPGSHGQLGGVFAVGEDDCELLDPLRTTGMAVSPDGSRLARLSWVENEGGVSEFLVSDALGLLSYRRLDEVGEPHSLLWIGDELHVVSTETNSVVVMDDVGRSLREWPAFEGDRAGDRWHLNSLIVLGGRQLISAFGRFDTVRGWSESGALDGAGIVLDLATREVVLSGFAAPHDPRRLEDGWLICNSGTGEVWRLDEAGQQTGAVHLDGWTRGVLIDGDVAYVGVSADRAAPADVRGRIAVIDLATFAEVSQFDLSCREVFEVLPYSEPLANGLRVGTSLGGDRGLGSASVVMDSPLDEVDTAARLVPIETTESRATVRLTNLSRAIMSGIGNHPVRVGARWWDAATGGWAEIGRAELPRPLYPAQDVVIRVELASLPPTGSPIQICVLQEGVRWFDEVNPEAAVEVYAPQ